MKTLLVAALGNTASSCVITLDEDHCALLRNVVAAVTNPAYMLNEAAIHVPQGTVRWYGGFGLVESAAFIEESQSYEPWMEGYEGHRVVEVPTNPLSAETPLGLEWCQIVAQASWLTEAHPEGVVVGYRCKTAQSGEYGEDDYTAVMLIPQIQALLADPVEAE